MNRLNQTEPATFSILSCWAFFRDSVFIYFKPNFAETEVISLWHNYIGRPACRFIHAPFGHCADFVLQ
jgi:hypothetical protein